MSNITVHSRFNRPKSAGQSFTETEPVYAMVTDDLTGLSEVRQTGERNAYSAIQAANVGLGIADFLRQYAIDPVTGLPNETSGKVDQFVDNYSLPKSMLDAHRLINRAAADWQQLDLSTRKAFNHDLANYLAWIDSNGGVESVKSEIKRREATADFLKKQQSKKEAATAAKPEEAN